MLDSPAAHPQVNGTAVAEAAAPMPLTQSRRVEKRLSRVRSSAGQLISLLGIALIVRLAWLLFTNFTYEDAFITFRFAERLAAGQGFVYNLGERIYGTTTPLLTLLLAGWLTIDPHAVVLGARIIGLASGLAAIVLAWAALGRLGITDARRFIPIALLACSDKLWVRDTSGMETSLVICLMMFAWYAAIRGWRVRSGLLAGLLLWTRIDLIVWVIALIIAGWVVERRPPIRLTIVTALTYAPWLIFAALYFGDPLPYTITAKWQAYFVGATTPYLDHLAIILRWLTPFSPPDRPGIEWSNYLWIVMLAVAAWGAREIRQIKWLAILVIFWGMEIVTLTLTRTTFQSRYFVPLWWATMLLLGLGLGSIWRGLSGVPAAARKLIGAAAIAGGLTILLGAGYDQAVEYHDIQRFVNDGALKPIGLWLSSHTPPGATVMLEPLGYIGYYADRPMIDEVGLISPPIVALKRDNVPLRDQVKIIQPDYIVIHCDDVVSWLDSAPNDFVLHYQRAAGFNPLNYDPQGVPADLPRTACYEVWGPRR
jgi:hypothetical protein